MAFLANQTNSPFLVVQEESWGFLCHSLDPHKKPMKQTHRQQQNHKQTKTTELNLKILSENVWNENYWEEK